jgi:hypothetical protein
LDVDILGTEGVVGGILGIETATLTDDPVVAVVFWEIVLGAEEVVAELGVLLVEGLGNVAASDEVVAELGVFVEGLGNVEASDEVVGNVESSNEIVSEVVAVLVVVVVVVVVVVIFEISETVISLSKIFPLIPISTKFGIVLELIWCNKLISKTITRARLTI